MKEHFIKFRSTLQNIEKILTNMISYKEKNSLTFFQNFEEIGKLKMLRFAIRSAIEYIDTILRNNNENNKENNNDGDLCLS